MRFGLILSIFAVLAAVAFAGPTSKPAAPIEVKDFIKQIPKDVLPKRTADENGSVVLLEDYLSRWSGVITGSFKIERIGSPKSDGDNTKLYLEVKPFGVKISGIRWMVSTDRATIVVPQSRLQEVTRAAESGKSIELQWNYAGAAAQFERRRLEGDREISSYLWLRFEKVEAELVDVDGK